MKTRIFSCLLALLVWAGFILYSPAAGAAPEAVDSETAVSETAPALEATTPPEEIPDTVVLTVGDALSQDDLAFAYGKKKTLSLDVVNHGGVAAQDVSLTPVISNDVSLFPFKITRADWTLAVTNASDSALLPEGLEPDDLSAAPEGHNRGFVTFVFDVRSDAPGGYYPLRFLLRYTQDGQPVTREILLQVTVETSAMARSKGGTGDAVKTDALQPEIASSTQPLHVMAGEPFTLSLTVTNPSPDEALTDLRLMAVSAQEGIFLPVTGASTLFLASLAPGASESFTLEMNTPADLAPQRYDLALKLEYSTPVAALHTCEQKVSIPVHQPAELTLSDITLVPETGEVDAPVNLMVNLYNTSQTQLNNVLVRLESDGAVRSEDYFAGNMAAGATSMMDVLITPLQSGELTCTLRISYEDEIGRSCQTEKVFTLKAELPASSAASVIMTPPAPDENPPDPGKTHPPLFMPVILSAAALFILLLVILLIVLRRRNRRHIRRNMDHYLDEE